MAQATKTAPVWVGGYGKIQHFTIARNEKEAIANLEDANPLLKAIGCTVEKLKDEHGDEIVASLPMSYSFGDSRRAKANKPAKAEKEPDPEPDQVTTLDTEALEKLKALEALEDLKKLDAHQEADPASILE